MSTVGELREKSISSSCESVSVLEMYDAYVCVFQGGLFGLLHLARRQSPGGAFAPECRMGGVSSSGAATWAELRQYLYKSRRSRWSWSWSRRSTHTPTRRGRTSLGGSFPGWAQWRSWSFL